MIDKFDQKKQLEIIMRDLAQDLADKKITFSKEDYEEYDRLCKEIGGPILNAVFKKDDV